MQLQVLFGLCDIRYYNFNQPSSVKNKYSSAEVNIVCN